MLLHNGYPLRLLREMSSEAFQLKGKSSEAKHDDGPQKIPWKLPFLDTSHTITVSRIKNLNKKLSNCHVRPVFYSFKTSSIFKTKDPVSERLQSSLVYRFDCQECQASYVGETKRHLTTRVKEHLNRRLKTEVGSHQHEISDKDFRIVVRHTHTKIAEAVTLKFLAEENRFLLNLQEKSVPLELFL